jgi:AraC family transcriptional regulator of adaptative response/methylated-DNA-[protein]-cysteine methyltransferase
MPTAAKPTLHLERMDAPLGPLLLGATAEALCLVEFVERKGLEAQVARVRRALGAVGESGGNRITRWAAEELAAYFTGARQRFTLPLVTCGTPFQESVWVELQRIPYGETRSYGEQARAIGQPRAVRAVARANGANRLAIVIPCHRVIGADGRLTGYAAGLERKRWLLDLERDGSAAAPPHSERERP